MLSREQLNKRLRLAVRHYWNTRARQETAQEAIGHRDAGSRSAVTGGKQLDDICNLVKDIVVDSGLPAGEVFIDQGNTVLPGFYRPTKTWDVVAVARDRDGLPQLVACIEAKSHAGPSFGNNFNNRVEEALGNSTDFWKAYEREVLPVTPRPFLGYFLLIEEADGSIGPTRTRAPHFAVDPVLRNTSYIERYMVFCERLVRERQYDATALVCSHRSQAESGTYTEPLQSATAWAFANTLAAFVRAYTAMRSD